MNRKLFSLLSVILVATASFASAAPKCVLLEFLSSSKVTPGEIGTINNKFRIALAKTGKVSLISKAETPNESRYTVKYAQPLGKKLKAEYVIGGRVIVSPSRSYIEARMTIVRTGQQVTAKESIPSAKNVDAAIGRIIAILTADLKGGGGSDTTPPPDKPDPEPAKPKAPTITVNERNGFTTEDSIIRTSGKVRGNVTAIWVVLDSREPVKASVSGTGWSTRFDGIDEGKHTVRVYAEGPGGKSRTHSYTFTRTRPAVAGVGAVKPHSVQVRLEGYVEGVVKNVYVSIDSGKEQMTTVNGREWALYTFLMPGDHTISVYGVSASGKKTVTQSFKVTVEAPNVKLH